MGWGAPSGPSETDSEPVEVRSTTSSGLPLTSALLAAPPVHIPDDGDGSYKTELVLERSPERTVKILWWHADDPRPEPHNHPWDFTSEILHGGYTEDRYVAVDTGGGGIQVAHTVHTYRAGDHNVVPRRLPDEDPRLLCEVFHNVRDVLPGTVTRMTCGPAVPGNVWHYLRLPDGHLLSSDDPSFIARFHRLNPHLRPRHNPTDGSTP